MMNGLEMLIVVFGGVLGGIALVLFGFLMLSILMMGLLLAWDNKRGKATPLDKDYTEDWEREFEGWRDQK